MDQSKHLLLVSSPQSVCSACSVPGLVGDSGKTSSKNSVQGSRDITQAPGGNWLLGLVGGSLWEIWGLPVTTQWDNFKCSNAASSPVWLPCTGSVSRQECGWWSWEVQAGFAFCFSTARAEHSHLEYFSTAALCWYHHASHCQVYTHTLWSNTTSQLQSFGPGNIIWVVSLVLVLQMPSGHRQYLSAECKTCPAPLQELHSGEDTH